MDRRELIRDEVRYWVSLDTKSGPWGGFGVAPREWPSDGIRIEQGNVTVEAYLTLDLQC